MIICPIGAWRREVLPSRHLFNSGLIAFGLCDTSANNSALRPDIMRLYCIAKNAYKYNASALTLLRIQAKAKTTTIHFLIYPLLS
jgi:hypothetical protein